MASYRLKVELWKLLEQFGSDSGGVELGRMARVSPRSLRRYWNEGRPVSEQKAIRIVPAMHELARRAGRSQAEIDQISFEYFFEKIPQKKKSWWDYDQVRRGLASIAVKMLEGAGAVTGQPVTPCLYERWVRAFFRNMDDHLRDQDTPMLASDAAVRRGSEYFNRSVEEYAEFLHAVCLCNPNAAWIKPHHESDVLDLVTCVLPLTKRGEELLLSGDCDEVDIVRLQGECPHADRFLVMCFAGDSRWPTRAERQAASEQLPLMCWQQIGRMSCHLEHADVRVYSFNSCPSQWDRLREWDFVETGAYFCRRTYNYPIVAVELNEHVSGEIRAKRHLMEAFQRYGRRFDATNYSTPKTATG